MSIKFESNLASVAQALRHGKLNLSIYLEHLEAHFIEENERVQAFLPEDGRFERLQRDAEELEEQYPNPEERPPLYGVPVGIKDIFHVDGFPTQAGSKLPVDVLAGPEAESVSQLKQAGALILGKTVTTEFAYFGPGPTRNPYNIEHTPGGSSSGSAAAVGANLSPLTLGTQTIGSVVRPASFCGCVGFKPTSARISAKNVIPLSPTLDHIGLFTQDVAGARLAASILCNNWETVDVSPGKPLLAIPAGPYLQKADTENLAHFKNTCQTLEQAGYKILYVETMPNFEQIYTQHNALVAKETADVHARWFAKYGQLYHPKTAGLIERGQQISADQAQNYNNSREKLRQELTTQMDSHNISLWIAPASVGTAPAGLDSTGDPIMNLPWTYAGLPAMNVPSGLAENGLPLGLQLVAGWWQDEQLLTWAEDIAQIVQ